MMKHLLTTIFLSVFSAWVVPAFALQTDTPVDAFGLPGEALVNEVGEIVISVQGKTIHVQNAQGEILEVFDLTGKKVVSQRIDSQDKKISLNLGKGIYVVRVNKQTARIVVQ